AHVGGIHGRGCDRRGLDRGLRRRRRSERDLLALVALGVFDLMPRLLDGLALGLLDLTVGFIGLAFGLGGLLARFLDLVLSILRELATLLVELALRLLGQPLLDLISLAGALLFELLAKILGF